MTPACIPSRAPGIALIALVALGPAGCPSGGTDGAQEGLPGVLSGNAGGKKLLKLVRSIPAAPARPFDRAAAEKLVALSLECVDRPYPYKPQDVLAGDEDAAPPRVLHPSFFGCFDWHSAVHGHWAMVRALRAFPDNARAAELRDSLLVHLGRESLEKEARQLARPTSATFERPYGLGWLLRLALEVRRMHDPDADVWRKNLEGLERAAAARLMEYLLKLSLPVRAGTHHNTAFWLAHAFDYAAETKNDELALLVKKKAVEYFGKDRACPLAYEPSGEDFLSPCLAEADIMRRVMPRDAFAAWFAAFMPAGDVAGWTALASPPVLLDKTDPLIGHLIGLALHRSWTMRSTAAALPPGDPRRLLFEKASPRLLDWALAEMEGSGYGGEHWLATFALFALSGANDDR